MQPISRPVWKLRRWEEKKAQESLQELFLPHLLRSCCWWWRGGRPSCQQKQKKLCVNLHSGECVRRRKCVYRVVTGRICGLHSPNCEVAFSCVTTSDHWTVPGLSRLRLLLLLLFFFGEVDPFSSIFLNPSRTELWWDLIVDDCRLNKVLSESSRRTNLSARRIWETEDMRLLVICALLLLKVSNS